MKYICGHERTRQLLEIWAKDKKLVISQYFFWNAGTPMQKSQEGLLQTLLYEILCQCPHLIQNVCSSRWHDDFLYQDSCDLWTKSDLIEAFRKLLHLNIGIKLCLFIDGLDEYGGDHSELVEVIEAWPQSQDIKLCLSSRPRNVFKDAFGHNTATKITLENFTAADIQKYVRGRLNMHKRFSWKVHRDKQYQELVEEIVEKSRGVFLWVFLVVKDLLHGVTNADPVPVLRQRLRDVPPELEDYFKQILSSIEERYQCQTAIIFQVAFTAAEPLPLILYSLLQQGAWERSPEATVPPISRLELRETEDDMHRQLNACTQSLLEVATPRRFNLFHEPTWKVDFLHRTFRDFLLSKEMQSIFQQRVPLSFNPRTALSQTILVRVKQIAASYKGDAHDLEYALRLIDDLIYYTHTAELHDNLTEMDVLNEAEKTITRFVTADKAITIRVKEVFTGVVVCNSLRFFVISRLKSTPIPKVLAAKMLWFALRPLRNQVAIELQDVMKYRISSKELTRRTGDYDIEMIKILLDYGVLWSSLSLWTDFLESLDQGEGKNYRPASLQIVALLLQNGASLHTVVYPRKYGNGPCPNPYCGPGCACEIEEPAVTAQQCLLSIFGDKATKSLLQQAGETPVETAEPTEPVKSMENEEPAALSSHRSWSLGRLWSSLAGWGYNFGIYSLGGIP